MYLLLDQNIVNWYQEMLRLQVNVMHILKLLEPPGLIKSYFTLNSFLEQQIEAFLYRLKKKKKKKNCIITMEVDVYALYFFLPPAPKRFNNVDKIQF